MKKEMYKKGFGLGAVCILLTLSLSAVAIPSNLASVTNTSNTSFLIRFEIAPNQSIGSENRHQIYQNKEGSALEIKIDLKSGDADELVEQLQKLNDGIKCADSIEDKYSLYSDSLKLLRSYGLLSSNFTINKLMKTAEEMVTIFLDNANLFPNIFNKQLTDYSIRKNQAKIPKNNPLDIGNNVDQGETRLDAMSGFFVITLFSEMSPWNVFVPILAADGNAFEVNITDFPIGQALVDMFGSRLENYTFPIGWTLGIGYVEILFVPGNALTVGQAAFSWPKAIPMYTYLYAGSSIVIPVAYGTASLTILLDRGPRQVPIPILDVGLFGSIITVHMPYSRDPNPS